MPDHRHGTLTGAQAKGCKHPDCTAAAARYHANRRQQLRDGTWTGLAPAAPARAIINTWLDEGITWVDMAEATGITEGAFRAIHKGENPRIQALTWDVIRDATPKPKPTGTVPNLGTLRRVHGLQAVGWSTRVIAETAGLSIKSVESFHRYDRVTIANRDAIIRAARHLIQREAPSDRSTVEGRAANFVRAHAARKGWVPLGAWDDVDNPHEVRKAASPTKQRNGTTPVDPDTIARIHRLKAEGLTDLQIAYQVGYKAASTIQKIRTRHPLEDTP